MRAFCFAVCPGVINRAPTLTNVDEWACTNLQRPLARWRVPCDIDIRGEIKRIDQQRISGHDEGIMELL
jgi:hypothetical protein